MSKRVLGGLLFAAGLVLMSSVASAQVFYQPVQYQYRYSYPGGRDVTFYYGGDNPRVFDYAARVGCLCQGTAGVREGRPGVGLVHAGLIGSPPFRVYSDCAPFQNVALYGFTPTDARNEAYARAPRYFTKAALLAAAVPVAEPEYFRSESVQGVPVNASRVLIAPAHGWPSVVATAGIDIRPFRRSSPAARPSTGPATAPGAAPAVEPRPLLIIPKRLLEPATPPAKSVAEAR